MADYAIDVLPECSVDFCGRSAAKRFSTMMEGHGEVELFYCAPHFDGFETKLAEVLGLPRQEVDLNAFAMDLTVGNIRDVIDYLDDEALEQYTAVLESAEDGVQ